MKLSDSEAGDRIAKALDVLGTERGRTAAADTALTAARKALHLLSFGLIAAGEKRDAVSDPTAPLDHQPHD
jgi:hypothetical protein